MTKLQKALPASYAGLNITLPGTLQASTRYEDLPMSSPTQTPGMTANALPMKSNNPYLQASQEQRDGLSPYEATSSRIALEQKLWRDSNPSFPISPPITPPSKESGHNSPWTPPKAKSSDKSAARQRSSSAPPAKTRRTSPRVAQDGHDSKRPPQYKQSQSNSCSTNCKNCGKRRPESLDKLRQTGAQSFPAGSARGIAVEPLHVAKKCGPNCTKCGKRKSTPSNAPRELPQAHTRSASEGPVRRSPPLPSMPAVPHSSFLGPTDLQHKHCNKCGKPKKPVSVQASVPQAGPATEPYSWPLPAATVPTPMPSPPIPIIMAGFENNQSTITLMRSSYIANEEDSPLIAKQSTDFNAMRNTASRGSYTRRPAPTGSSSGPTGLIRRISNALRPSTEPVAVATPPAATRPAHVRQGSYLSVPRSGARPDSSPRPFSFVGAASDGEFEMTDLRLDEAEAEPELQTTSKPRYDMDDMDDDEAVERFDKANAELLARDNTVMRRAVSGSIRRFKSLRGAHRNWYRSDMAMEGIGYDYDEGRAVGVY